VVDNDKQKQLLQHRQKRSHIRTLFCSLLVVVLAMVFLAVTYLGQFLTNVKYLSLASDQSSPVNTSGGASIALLLWGGYEFARPCKAIRTN